MEGPLGSATGAGGGERASQPRTPALLLILLALGAGYVLALLVWPLLPAIVTSAVLALLVHPAHARLEARSRWAAPAALVSTLLTFFLVLLPILGISVLLLGELRDGVGWLAGEAAGILEPRGVLAGWIAAAATHIGVESTTISATLAEQIEGAAAIIASRSWAFLSGLGGWALQAGAALFTLYYLLKDGRRLVRTLKWLVPLEPAQTERLFDRAREVTFATVYGNVVVAAVQGALGGLGFWALGVEGAALWGTVMGLLSLLPVIGPPLVWVPAGVVLLLHAEIARGLLLLAFGTLIISTVDNLLRALLVSDRAQLHPLVVFFSVIGGLYLFGAVGVFLGPVAFVVCFAVVEMARQSLDAGNVPTGGLLSEMPRGGWAAPEAAADKTTTASAGQPPTDTRSHDG